MNIKFNKPMVALSGGVLASFVSLGLYFLILNRRLPFLKNETVFSGGKEVPTEEFIELTSPMFLYVAPVFVLVGLVNYFILKNRANKI